MSKKGETVELRPNFTKTVLSEGEGDMPRDGLLCTLHYHGMVRSAAGRLVPHASRAHSQPHFERDGD